ncbi:MAG: hypothetical protein GY814_00565 [Gammaproteobacteria bacterium]|nr:hypothetical protein [Gammaproteobacteria bacterium]
MLLNQLLILTVLIIYSQTVIATDQGTLLFENQSAHDIKVVAPGIGFILPAGESIKKVSLQSNNALGVNLNIWWKQNPRELCQLFTPWSRKVLITGKRSLACLSKN